MTDFNNVVSQFRINGIVESVSPIGNGLINETLRVSTIGKDTPDYILQRINDAILPMLNSCNITLNLLLLIFERS